VSRLPWFLGGGALAAYLIARGRRADPPSDLLAEPPPSDARAAPPQTPATLPGRWVWPIAAWNGRSPVISDGFGSPRAGYDKHGGVDLMFPRAQHDTFTVGSSNGSKLFVMPDGTQALAASDGVIWSAMKTPKGYAVVIDHAPRKVATFYTHLDQLAVPLTQPGPNKTKTTVQAGQPLGIVGASPEDRERLKHLHFEVWLGGPSDRIDPAKLMSAWEVIRSPLGPLVARNAGADDLVRVVAHYRSRPGTSLRSR